VTNQPPKDLAEYLRSVGYTPSTKKPDVIPVYPLDQGHIALLKQHLVGAILAHLAINYKDYKFIGPDGNRRSDAKIYEILENFFGSLSRACKNASLSPAEISASKTKENVSLPALIQMSMRTKYPPLYGKVFDIYDPVDITKEAGMQGNVFDLVELDTFNHKWLDGEKVKAYAANVYNHPNIRDLITRALEKGNFNSLKGKTIEFPDITMRLVSLPNGGVSGFAGPNTLYIGVNEFVEKAQRYSDKFKATDETIETWVQMQLAATVIHEASHVVLRYNYQKNINISSPFLAPLDGTPATPESGYLSEIAFSTEYAGGKPGHIFLWDLMIIGGGAWSAYLGPGPTTGYKEWVDAIVKVFAHGGNEKLLAFEGYFGDSDDEFHTYFCPNPSDAASVHQFAI
jgi:hypothetical protein